MDFHPKKNPPQKASPLLNQVVYPAPLFEKALRICKNIFPSQNKQKVHKRIFSKSGAGFTLVEVLLTLAMVGIIAASATPIYQALQNRNDLDIAINTTAQAMRRAQLLSQAVVNDTTWGVKILIGKISIFQGASYAGRDQNFDEDFSLPSSINLSGLDEAVFAKLSGFPLTSGALTLSSPNNESRTLTLNSKGAIAY